MRQGKVAGMEGDNSSMLWQSSHAKTRADYNNIRKQDFD